MICNLSLLLRTNGSVISIYQLLWYLHQSLASWYCFCLFCICTDVILLDFAGDNWNKHAHHFFHVTWRCWQCHMLISLVRLSMIWNGKKCEVVWTSSYPLLCDKFIFSMFVRFWQDGVLWALSFRVQLQMLVSFVYKMTFFFLFFYFHLNPSGCHMVVRNWFRNHG